MLTNVFLCFCHLEECALRGMFTVLLWSVIAFCILFKEEESALLISWTETKQLFYGTIILCHEHMALVAFSTRKTTHDWENHTSRLVRVEAWFYWNYAISEKSSFLRNVPHVSLFWKNHRHNFWFSGVFGFNGKSRFFGFLFIVCEIIFQHSQPDWLTSFICPFSSNSVGISFCCLLSQIQHLLTRDQWREVKKWQH